MTEDDDQVPELVSALGNCLKCKRVVTEQSSYVNTPTNEYLHQACSQFLHGNEIFLVKLGDFLDAAGECTDADEQEWYVTKVKEMGVYIYNRFVQTLDHPHTAAAMQLLEAMVNWRRRLEKCAPRSRKVH
jgi:hypothetical protein